jgi:hypothetical protein
LSQPIYQYFHLNFSSPRISLLEQTKFEQNLDFWDPPVSLSLHPPWLLSSLSHAAASSRCHAIQPPTPSPTSTDSLTLIHSCALPCPKRHPSSLPGSRFTRAKPIQLRRRTAPYLFTIAICPPSTAGAPPGLLDLEPPSTPTPLLSEPSFHVSWLQIDVCFSSPPTPSVVGPLPSHRWSSAVQAASTTLSMPRCLGGSPVPSPCRVGSPIAVDTHGEDRIMCGTPMSHRQLRRRLCLERGDHTGARARNRPTSPF